jgi:alanine-synthesizing transaminase
VLIMPGYFYDFPREAYLVVSLLPDPAVFNEAVARVLARAEAEPRG